MRLRPEGARVLRVWLATCVWLAACVSSHQLIGTARTPIPADEVRLFNEDLGITRNLTVHVVAGKTAVVRAALE